MQEQAAKHEINIAKDFTRAPGPRYIIEGDYSGELFRKNFLEPLFIDPSDQSKIFIDLDGTIGYGTSFLEEAFGGIVRVTGDYNRCNARFEFKSEEEQRVLAKIKEYMKDATKRK